MLATKIRGLCRERGISVTDLEKMAGLGKNTIYYWDDIEPGVEKVKRVAAVLGVTMDELLREEEANDAP